MESEHESNNLSLILEDALRAKNLNQEKLAQLSGISERFLKTLLEGNYKNLPAAPYIHGYMMRIADILGLDGEMLWNRYFEHHEYISRSGTHDHLPLNRFLTPHIHKKIVIIGGIVLLLVLYVLVRGPALLGMPTLSLQDLNEDVIRVHEKDFLVKGTVGSSNQLTINHESVYPDKEGTFSYSLTLQEGANTLTVVVKKLLGKTVTITKQIFYEPSKKSEATSTLSNDTDQEIPQ